MKKKANEKLSFKECRKLWFRGRAWKQSLVAMLVVSLVVTMVPIVPGFGGQVYGEASWEAKDGMALVVTGDAVVTKPVASTEAEMDDVKESLANERAYTRNELLAMDQVERNFSALNSGGSIFQILAKGIDLETILSMSGFNPETSPNVTVNTLSYAKNGTVYDSKLPEYGSTPRYYYDDLASGSESEGDITKLILAFEVAEIENKNGVDDIPDIGDLKAIVEKDAPRLFVGQVDRDDKNAKLQNKNVQFVLAGNEVAENSIDIFGKTYTRAQLMKMDRVTYTYEYKTSGENAIEKVRGVALADLLALSKDKIEDYKTIIITPADDDGTGKFATKITAGEIRNGINHFMVAYEYFDNKLNEWIPTYDKAKKGNIFGAPKLYGGLSQTPGIYSQPNKMIASISLGTEKSLFKHMTYHGSEMSAHFAPDAITSATLTVEGPGLENTTPVLMRELEETKDANVWRGPYTDKRGTYTYEGVKVSSLIQGSINSNIKRVNDDIKIILKNRWRQNVAEIEYSDLLDAKTPVILAWGISDGTTTAPFVFDGSAVLEVDIYRELGIDDGCLKLVYDKDDPALKNVVGPDVFKSVAYVYVENKTGAPGFKHTKSANEAYNNPANTQYIVSFNGSVLGREVNYTVEDLEKMVEYDVNTGAPKSDGIGHRAEYNLSNTTYWYVNEYEGVKLWELLTSKLGVDKDRYDKDDETLVSFAAWDHYQTTASFSMKQLANPDLFYFYEKSPLDMGTDRPTKAQLATEEYQPDNQIGEWEKDHNGYPVKKGYPVVLAYGVNGYPYVRTPDMEGFAGGLGNGGGPLRVIFGKADGMNRKNSNAEENYAYFYNNGSNQLQRVQEIFVGENIRYNTHIQNPKYESMADEKDALIVEVIQADGTTSSTAFTLRDLEELLYKDTVSPTDRQDRQEKANYFYKKAGNGDSIQDLFEGVNLYYLLFEAVGMQGTLGSVSFYPDGSDKAVGDQIPLTSINYKGYNSINGTEGLSMMVAFAKNGYPLVSENSGPRYVSKDEVTGKTIKNSDGPLMLISPQTEEEKNSETIGNLASVKNLKKIVVNLEKDNYGHTGEVYGVYGNQTVKFTGGVKNQNVELKVSDIEKAQKYLETDIYTVGGKESRYRGLNLRDFLFSSHVSASNLLSKIIVKNDIGKEFVLTAKDLTEGVNGKPVIIAYGIGNPENVPADGKPLVPDSESAGYESVYDNKGGPLRLVINNGTGTECIENISEINIEVAEVDGWTHSFGVYETYANQPALRISGSDISKTTDFTVAEIEGLPASYKIFGQYKMGNNVYVQGIDLWKLINEHIGLKDGQAFTGITAYANDGYATTFNATQVKNGVNGKPILVAYGIGTTSDNGLPLVGGDDQTNIKPGYSSTAGNAFGPLRIIIHDNTGWCVKWLDNIVVGIGSYEKPEAKKGTFEITGNEIAVPKTYNITELATLGEVTKEYPHDVKNVGKVIDQATGVMLKNLLQKADVYGDQYIYNVKTTDNTTNAAYLNIMKQDIEGKDYLLAYKEGGKEILDKDKAGAESIFRIYRNEDTGGTWKNRLTSVIGIEAFDTLSGKVVFSITVDNDTVAELTRNDLANINSPAEERTIDSDIVSGITIEDLFSDLGMKNKSSRVTIKDKAGAIADLTDKTIEEIADYFLAWKLGDNFIADEISDEIFALRLYGEGESIFKSITGASAMPLYNWENDKLGSLAAASVRNIISDKAGGYWIGTTAGLFHYSADGTITKPYTKNNGKLMADYVIDVAMDESGGLWISQGWTYAPGGSNYGIVHIDSTGKSTNYTVESTNGGLPHDYVQALQLDEKGNLWIGSFGGLTKYDTNKKTWRTWGIEEGLPAISVNTLVQDGRGGLWIGCYPNGQQGGLQPPFTGGYAYLGPDETLKTWYYQATEENDLNELLLGDFWVRGIAVDADGGAWIARSGAAPGYFNSPGYHNIDISECVGGRLDYVSPDKKTVTHYTGRELIDAIDKGIFAADPEAEDEIIRNGATPEIRAVAVDGQGGLWLGTSGLGVFHIKSLGEVEAHYSTRSFDWKSKHMDNVYFLAATNDGTILSGSNGGFALNKFSGIDADAGLKNLASDVGILSPSFNENVSNYTLAIPKDITNVTFYGTPISLGSTVKYNGKTDTSVDCVDDMTSVTIEVSAGGNAKAYNVKVIKQKIATTDNPVDAKDAATPLAIRATANNTYITTNAAVSGQAKVATLPLINAETRVDGGNAALLISESTKVTGNDRWDGKLYLPSILSKGSVSIPSSKSIDYVVTVGSSTEQLSFDKPFRLYLPNMGGKTLGFIPAGSSQVHQITNEINLDSGTALGASEDFGYILVDNKNVAIWARKAGTFVAYTLGSDSGIPQEEFAIVIDGPGVKSEKGYTLAQLLNWKGKFTGYYRWLNNWNTRGGETHTGIKLTDLLEASGLTDNAVSITLKASDGFVREFNLGDGDLGVDKVYPNNLYMILEVAANGKIQLIVPQENNNSINKPHWASGINRITVNLKEVKPGGGTSGAGEGGPPAEQPGADEKPITETVRVQVKAGATVNNGIASSKVTVSDIKKALEDIGDGSDKDPSSKGIIEIISTSGSSEKIKKAQVSIPMAAVASMAGPDNTSALLKTDLGIISFDPGILNQIAAQSGDNLVITIETADEGLTAEDRALVGNRPVLDIKLSIDGQDITDFGGKTVLAGMPYKSADGENGNNLIAIYMDGSNKGMPVKLSAYDNVAKHMLFRTGHLSLYGIAYRDVNFSDINNHWAKEGIKFLANKNILKGKGANRFDPDGSVTRAEFVTMLANSMDGIVVKGAKSAGFDDVASGAWYADYVNWAVSGGIVSGYGNGKFGPNDKITREQMALMTDNFINSMKMKPDVVKAKTDFVDNDSISGWSATAVTKVQQYGIINGNPDGTFAPKATATRAQAAIILKGYIESLLK